MAKAETVIERRKRKVKVREERNSLLKHHHYGHSVTVITILTAFSW